MNRKGDDNGRQTETVSKDSSQAASGAEIAEASAGGTESWANRSYKAKAQVLTLPTE
jgi:ABC-type xylose transport system substrate-binding protein